jgi:UDP-glucose 4-epimerase
LLVAEKGDGDGFELGAEEAYSILDLAKLWGQPIIMGPERKGNRMKAY